MSENAATPSETTDSAADAPDQNWATGRPVHFEIQAADPQRAIEFYTSVFGWSTEDWSEFAGMPYFGVTTGTGPGIDGVIGALGVGLLRSIRHFDPIRTADFFGAAMRRIGPRRPDLELVRGHAFGKQDSVVVLVQPAKVGRAPGDGADRPHHRDAVGAAARVGHGVEAGSAERHLRHLVCPA